MQKVKLAIPAGQKWLETPTGRQLLHEELQQVRSALDRVFGDQFLQIGRWGDIDFHAYARTQRATVAAESLPCGLISRPEQLSIATDSIDVAFLPHVLESHRHPHAVLREVDRVLRSDGHLIITGFNPISLWGLRHLVSRRRFPAGGHRMLTQRRLRDWLALLDYSVDDAAVFNFRSPFFRAATTAAATPAANEMDNAQTGRNSSRFTRFVSACRRRSPFAGCYILIARKRMITLTPMRPEWRRRPRLVGGLVNPTTRNVA